MDQRQVSKTMQGFFITRRWKQPRDTQQSKRDNRLEHYTQARKPVESDERHPELPCETQQQSRRSEGATARKQTQAGHLSRNNRVKSVFQGFLHKGRASGLSKATSKVPLKFVASERRGPCPTADPHIDQVASTADSEGSEVSRTRRGRLDHKRNAHDDRVVATESPARRRLPTQPTGVDQHCDLAAAVGLMIPATCPEARTSPFSDIDRRGKGGSERSDSPDLVCDSFRLAWTGSPKIPHTGVAAHDDKLPSGASAATTRSRKRPRQLVDSQLLDRFPPPEPRRRGADTSRLGKCAQKKEGQALMVDLPSVDVDATGSIGASPSVAHESTERYDVQAAQPRVSSPTETVLERPVEEHNANLSLIFSTEGKRTKRVSYISRQGIAGINAASVAHVHPTTLSSVRRRARVEDTTTNPIRREACAKMSTHRSIAAVSVDAASESVRALTRQAPPTTTMSAMSAALGTPRRMLRHDVISSVETNAVSLPTLLSSTSAKTSSAATTTLPIASNAPAGSSAGLSATPREASKFAKTPTGRRSSDEIGSTQAERIFARAHGRVFKSSGGGSRGLSKATTTAGKGNRKFKAPVAAQGGLTGVWRRGRKGAKWYITLDGRKLSGTQAYEVFSKDKMKLKRAPQQRVPDASTITSRSRQYGDVEAPTQAFKLDGGSQLSDNDLKLSTYGVPEQVGKSYANRGVTSLYRWQAECLRVGDSKPLSGGNLVYSAPTGGGKTLVAEILLLRALIERKGTMAIFVVPFIALAMEKRDYLREVWAALEMNVQAFHGSAGGDDSMDGVHLCVCTMEKANSIVNRLAEENRLEALSIVVVDEMHLIGDGQRGFLLELMLSKLRMVCPTTVQLACLSATLPNAGILARWLDASLYESQFRPLGLRHRVCCERAIYVPEWGDANDGKGSEKEAKFVKEGTIKSTGGRIRSTDPEGVVDLVEDALDRDMSVLVFCPNKRWCQELANLLAREIRKHRNQMEIGTPSSATTRTTRVQGTNLDGPRRAIHRSRTPVNQLSVGQEKQGAQLDEEASRKGEKEPPHALASYTPLAFVSAKAVRESVAATDAALDASTPARREKDEGATEEGMRDTVDNERQRLSVSARADTLAVMNKLRETPVGLDPQLSWLVGEGVAFHHSGLVVEERSILEEAFREGSIRVLVATSTLAAGVNLPAHRVIIRSPKIGIGNLDSTRYHQMAGRSGRAGVSRGESRGMATKDIGRTAGEAFLFLSGKEKLETALKLISAPLPPLKSALRRATGGGLERAILEVVVSKIVSNKGDARRFVSHTLLAAETEAAEMAQASDAAINFLVEKRFIVADGRRADGGKGDNQNDHGAGDDFLSPTQLGKATFFSGFSPAAAVDVQSSLEMACTSLVVNTNLHALYLLTPLDGLEPDWASFRDEFTGWGNEDSARVVGKAVGIEAGVLVNAAGQHRPTFGMRYYTSSPGSGRSVDLLPYRRFYAALVLQKAVDEVPLRNMAAKFGVARGALQGLQKDAAVFCGMVVSFCRHLQWHELAHVLFSLQDRLDFSAKPELLPLVRLSRDLAPFRARALLEAGYPTPLEIARVDPARLAEVFLRCSPFRSAGYDEAMERHRALQSRRLAENIQALAMTEIRRQLAERLSQRSSCD